MTIFVNEFYPDFLANIITDNFHFPPEPIV